MTAKYLIGIDEVGRGPLAGPVTVCAFAVAVSNKKVLNHFRGVRESKQLTEESREAWFGKIEAKKKAGLVDFKITSVSSNIIDSKGLSFALNFAIKMSLKKLSLTPAECFVYLDGGIKAPAEYIFQKTIIKGDEKMKIIALASIAAKVTRDREMVRRAKEFPRYGFDQHKGYGTKKHYETIKKHGPSAIHRKSFLTRLTLPKKEG